MHGCYHIAENTIAKDYLSPLQRFALILSGLCHDVNHTAHTNVYEVYILYIKVKCFL